MRSKQHLHFRRNAGFAFCLLVGLSFAAQSVFALDPITLDPFYCAADAYNDGGGTAKMNCTSGDITIAAVNSVTIEGNPTACEEGVDILTVTELDYDLQQNSNSDRYDVIAWISKFGNAPKLPTGNQTSCIATSFNSELDTNSGALDFMGDFDGDLCTDMSYTATPQGLVSTVDFDILCNDSDDDGFLDIPVLISWGNQDAELNCGNTDPVLQPGNKSKCSVNLIATTVSVEANPNYNLSITKTATDVDGDGTGAGPVDAAGDIISYEVVITNTGDTELTGVNAGDNLLLDFSCNPAVPLAAPLAPQDTVTCTGTYTAIEEDLEIDSIDNQAFVTSTEAGLRNAQASVPVEAVIEPPPPSTPVVSVPVNRAWALALLVVLTLCAALYYRPARQRRD